MRHSLWIALFCLCWPCLLHADEADFADLRARLDALEAENRELKETVSRALPQLEVDAGGSTVATSRSSSYYANDLPVGSDAEEARIRGVVEQYLTSRDIHVDGATATTKEGDGFTEVGTDTAMTAQWRNGLELATKDKAFRVHVGGRWQLDVPWLSAEDQVNDNLPGDVRYRDGIDFRRARLRVDGTMYEQIEFAMEYDFINGFRERNGTAFNDIAVTAITDLWLQFSHLPIGNLRIGNQKDAIGFEHIVSSRFLPFMERSYNQDTFYGGTFNGFMPGASLSDNMLGDRGSWNIGVYKPVNNVFAFSNNDGDYAVTGRLTYLPIYENEGRQVLHVGVSGRQSTTYDDRIRFRTRDALRAGLSTQWPVPADITVFGDTTQWVNGELAAINGPWTLQAEWLVANTHDAQRIAGAGGVGPVVENLMYQGGYVQLLYFLTGESDNYSLERMAFDRVKPFENSFWVPTECGSCFAKGAWQVGGRYNYLDLNDQGINGGELHNLTAGLNWFWNPNTKWQFNYIATYRDVDETATFPDGSGWIHGWGMRFAQDF